MACTLLYEITHLPAAEIVTALFDELATATGFTVALEMTGDVIIPMAIARDSNRTGGLKNFMPYLSDNLRTSLAAT
jgi:hypothetical protein